MPGRFINPNNIPVIDKSIKKIRHITKDRDIKNYLNSFEGILAHLDTSEENNNYGLI